MKQSLRFLAATVMTASVVAPISSAHAGTGTQAAATVAAIGAAGTGGSMTGATAVCGGTAQKTAVYGGSGNPITTSAVFIKSGFDVQCSNNVLMYAIELSGNSAAVASGSLKGNQSFQGQTNGGAIVANVKCTGLNDMCLNADVTDALKVACSAAGGTC